MWIETWSSNACPPTSRRSFKVSYTWLEDGGTDNTANQETPSNHISRVLVTTKLISIFLNSKPFQSDEVDEEIIQNEIPLAKRTFSRIANEYEASRAQPRCIESLHKVSRMYLKILQENIEDKQYGVHYIPTVVSWMK